MITLPLRRRDGSTRATVLLDDGDIDLARHAWHYIRPGYAARKVYTADGHRVTHLLHRELMGVPPGDPRVVDHRDGNVLNCRRTNLIVTTLAGNAQNLAPRGLVPLRGVTPHRNRWRARAWVAGSEHHLGTFDTPELAHAAASAFRAQHMPLTNERRAA